MKTKSTLFLLLTIGLLFFALYAAAADLGLFGGGDGRGDAMAEILGQTMDSITVTSPNGAESWTVGSSHSITWSSTGTVGNVNIDYSTNNGGSWTSVAANTANDGTQPWTIPSTPSTTCLVRVQETDGSPSDSSDAVFTILAVSTTSITVTLPNGGENWTAGSMVDIYWTSTGAISNVNIDYSVDGGSNWLPILAGTSNDGHCGDWVLPDITSATCLVRVSDAANAAVNDVSDAFFSITIREDDIYEENDTLAAAAEMTPGIHYGLILRDDDYFKVYVEAGKDLVVRTMGAAISAAEVSDIDIELYNASGDLLVSSAGDSTMETLCLSNLAAGWYYIRGYWLGTAHYYALGIESGDLPLGEVRGRVTDIHGSGIANVWVTFYEPSGSWSLVRGYVLTDSNGDYRFAYSAGDHKVLFDACYHTNQVVGSYVNEWYNDAATIDTAQTLTTAAGSSLTGIDAVLGDAGMITGVVTGPEGEPLLLARVQAYDASGTRKASTYTLADGTYRLRGIAAAGNYIVRFLPRNWTTAFAVEWYNNKSSSGAADAVAVVLASETPNINAQLGYGGSIGGTVTDAASGLPIANVIVYAVDPDNYIVISSALTNASGQYTVFWIPAGNVKLYFNAGTTGYGSEWYSDKASFATADLVPVAAAQNVTGINAQLATASPTITVTSPNGGESWSVGSSHNITWTTTGTIADVKIEYSTDSGTSYTTVIASTANTGSYAWTVPSTLSTTCMVRVSDAADGDPLDASDAVFTIVSPITDSITVTAPNGGESWTVGSSHDITWSSTGTIANVRIEYSTNNGSDWSDVIASTANTGTYAWTIPNAPSTTCSVRVSDAANAAVNDASDAVFTIVLSDDDIYEDNDTLAAAATLTPGVYEGLVLRDEDYFKVYVEEGKDLQVSISGAALPPASVGDMDIELYDASGNLLVAAASDSTSEMLYLSNLAAGWYYIRNAWVGTPHNYTLGIFSGDLPLGEISGRVTDIRGSGIANVLVMFYEPSGSWSLLRGYALTDSNGDYRFAYTAGDHKVQFSTTRPECTVIGSYVDEWYDDVATLGEAQTLSTAAGSSMTGIDAVLGDAGMITGVVTGPEGQPLNYAQVRAYDESGIARVGTRTLPDGTYQLRGIPTSGNYRVRFIAYYWGYALEWYDNKSWSGTADAVAVVLREETPNINAQLGYGGSIAGQVTDAVSGLPIANVTVSARDEANIAFSSSVTDASGQYTINQVPACNVKLYFNAGTTGYASEWYNDKADFATADLVPVAAGQNVTGINAQLLLASITVTSPNGGESWTVGSSHDITWTTTGTIANVNIDYSTNNGGSWASVAANTANDGTQPWTIPSTPSTTCLVRVSDTDGDPTDTSNAVFTIAAAVTETVSAPDEPTGPATGTISTSYEYSSGSSTSSLGHDVQYFFDWDDGSDSDWLAVGTTSASHAWSANGTYHVRAMACCATHTTVESLWSETHTLVISDSIGYYNSPASRQILPEVIWAPATGGGTWVSDVQLVDVSGGSQVTVYYSTAAGRRGPFLLWNNSGGSAMSSVKYANLLQTIDGLDSGVFTYDGTVGAVEFATQDGSHLIHVAVRELNGNYAKTFPGLNLVDEETAGLGRNMIIPNLANNATYRTTCGFYNPTADAVTMELKLLGASGVQTGSTITRTLAGYEFTAFNPFTEAGVPYPGSSYDNVTLKVEPTTGSGSVMCFGATANNTSNDPAAHLAVQASGYDNGPSNYKILPEVIWASATGGGTWVSDVQVVDVSGGSQVTVYYSTATGRRGPFLLWNNSGGSALSSVKYANLLQTIDGLDSGAFTYNGTVGAVEFATQDSGHLIHVAVRELNGNYAKTFPGLNLVNAETAGTGRLMIIPNLANNATYRTTCGFYNPTAVAVTMELKLLGASGVQTGSTITRTLAGYEFTAFNPFTEAGVPYPGSSYDNVTLKVEPTTGSGSVMCFGATANNTSNDPAAHVAVQAE